MIVTIKKGPEITVIHYACSSNLVAEKFEHNVFTISCMQLDDKLESKGERERERERERGESYCFSIWSQLPISSCFLFKNERERVSCIKC